MLDPLCLVGVNINPESRVKVAAGEAPPRLLQQGRRVFLVKVHNEAGVTAALRVSSPNAEPLVKRSTGSPDPEITIKPQEVGDRWLDVAMIDGQPLNKTLSGLPLEYRLIELYSRDVGRREAKLVFDVGQGTQDLGFRNEVNILFNCEPAVEVTLEILDDDGSPTTGHFVIRDAKGPRLSVDVAAAGARLFLSRADLSPQRRKRDAAAGQVHRAPTAAGRSIACSRSEITVPDSVSHKETFQLERWIKMADYGWFSGDHHIHAAGCAHYESPTEGVQPVDMMRHILGEDLNVGCVLSWGPCWYFQKQYFDGKVHELSQPRLPDALRRRSVRLSQLALRASVPVAADRRRLSRHHADRRVAQLGLAGAAMGQGAGGRGRLFAQRLGAASAGHSLPTYEMPKFDGIGANEYIVDVVHDACDFISAVDTPAIWELNIWYHTLNCGYTCRISGETDFPCIYGDKVGLGRAYVKLDKDEPLDYDKWVLRLTRRAQLLQRRPEPPVRLPVNGLGVGEKGEGGRASVLAVEAGQPLEIKRASRGAVGR